MRTAFQYFLVKLNFNRARASMQATTNNLTGSVSLDQRIEKLESIEKDIGKLISLSANAVKELYKTNPSNETVEYTTKDFVKTLDGIDKCLSEQIQYLTQVSTMQPHEGSVYGAEKDYELSCLQTALTKERFQRLQAVASAQRREQLPMNGHSSTPSLPPPKPPSLPPTIPPSIH